MLAYNQESEAQEAPSQRILVKESTEKQRALDMYAAGIGLVGWPNLPAVLLEEEGFWEFDYTKPA